MIDKKIVHEVLKVSLESEAIRKSSAGKLAEVQDSIISLLIHDIFGGDILKTHWKKRWHFYNRVNGERIDFTLPEIEKSNVPEIFEDIPATPAETYNYVDVVDYSDFFMRFVRVFEETIGLGKFRSDFVL